MSRVYITDTSLRDAHQSLLATRMRYEETMADVIRALIEWVDSEDQPWRR